MIEPEEALTIRAQREARFKRTRRALLDRSPREPSALRAPRPREDPSGHSRIL